jgi:hypothetical protein
MIKLLLMICARKCSPKLAKQRGSPPLPTLQVVVADRTVVTVVVRDHQTAVTVAVHAHQTAVTVAAGSARTTGAVMTVTVVVMMVLAGTTGVMARARKIVVLHGVMMVAMSAAVMMEDMTVADVGTGAFPPPMWM